jgi:hypothetical protein
VGASAVLVVPSAQVQSTSAGAERVMIGVKTALSVMKVITPGAAGPVEAVSCGRGQPARNIRVKNITVVITIRTFLMMTSLLVIIALTTACGCSL